MKGAKPSIRHLQRALNALDRGPGRPRLHVDGWPGRKTLAAFVGFLAARGREGEARLLRAIRALAGLPMASANIETIRNHRRPT